MTPPGLHVLHLGLATAEYEIADGCWAPCASGWAPVYACLVICKDVGGEFARHSFEQVLRSRVVLVDAQRQAVLHAWTMRISPACQVLGPLEYTAWASQAYSAGRLMLSIWL